MLLLVLPVLLAAPLLLLAAAVVDLTARGPLGWLAAAGMLVTVVLGTRWTARRVRRWWRSTKAPDLVREQGTAHPNG